MLIVEASTKFNVIKNNESEVHMYPMKHITVGIQQRNDGIRDLNNGIKY
jgi:hypothetical protein